MENFTPIAGCYKIATKAVHRLCCFQDETPQLCYVYGEISEDGVGYWVGRWIFDYKNVFHVRYPKSTTRLLSEDDKKGYSPKLLDDIRNGIYTPDLVKVQI